MNVIELLIPRWVVLEAPCRLFSFVNRVLNLLNMLLLV